MNKISKRRFIREKVLQILYAYELNNQSLSETMNLILKEIKDKKEREFAELLASRVITNKAEIDKKISLCVDNWEMSRVALIDKLLLRMGLCEILYFPDIPPKVSINETIEIAKAFSTAGSGKFINGILDAILSDLKSHDILQKEGRGLVEESIKDHRKKNNQ
ncbi:MAG TPA: transcription antitermination factor NusB [Ignavibacteriaceae bacterium]|nr:transcription antitermination factor NusB [Ignavibacteriaceae bacterium]